LASYNVSNETLINELEQIKVVAIYPSSILNEAMKKVIVENHLEDIDRRAMTTVCISYVSEKIRRINSKYNIRTVLSAMTQ
jgi:hypothetical protein